MTKNVKHFVVGVMVGIAMSLVFDTVRSLEHLINADHAEIVKIETFLSQVTGN